jgi:hypothetical protein
VGDFNGDGKPDFAVLDNHNAGSAFVFLNNGDGTFLSTGPYFTSSTGGSSDIAAADLRGNGIDDLIVVNPGGQGSFGNVAVLLGNGDGTFHDPRDFAAGLRPTSVTVGNVYGDGIPDLIVASNVRDTISVLRGNGDGTFQDPQTFDIGSSPNAVAVGDFNRDGRADLAVADGWFGGSVDVLLGNGDGTFQPGTHYRVGTEPLSVVAADLTGNGLLDLVTPGSVLLGNGDGSFQNARNYGAGSGPSAVALADFAGHAFLDLAITNRNDNDVTVLLGNGDGTFQSVTNLDTGISYGSVVAGDFNGDGISDLAVTGYPLSGNNDVTIFLGNGDGTFRPGPSFNLAGIPRSIVVGDFTGDGVQDDLAVSTDSFAGGMVWVLLGNGDGTFQTPVGYAVGSDPGTLAAGALTGSGIVDVVVTTADQYGAGAVKVFLGNGDGTFQAPASYDVGPFPKSVAVGDFNGDHHLDLVVSNDSGPNGTVTVLLGNGDGTFQPRVTFAAGPRPGSVTVADLRGNGILDLVVAHSLAGVDRTVSVLMGYGDGTFAPPVAYPVGLFPTSVLVGDFDHHGRLDLAVANTGSGTVSVLRSNGDGTFAPGISYGVGWLGSSLAAGDFNGDGFLDLVTTTAGGVAVLLNAADGSPPPAPSHPRRPALHLRSHTQAQRDPEFTEIVAPQPQTGFPYAVVSTDQPAAAVHQGPAEIGRRQLWQAEAIFSPFQIVTSRHAEDALFEEWGNALVDTLARDLLT